jgi:hypothetical protein
VCKPGTRLDVPEYKNTHSALVHTVTLYKYHSAARTLSRSCLEDGYIDVRLVAQNQATAEVPTHGHTSIPLDVDLDAQ